MMPFNHADVNIYNQASIEIPDAMMNSMMLKLFWDLWGLQIEDCRFQIAEAALPIAAI